MMILTTFLFNPVIRVWNLRLLLVSIIGVMVIWTWSVRGRLTDPLLALLDPALFRQVIGLTIGFGLGFFHHVSGVFRWKLGGLALVDLGLVLSEIAALVFLMLPTRYRIMYTVVPMVSLFLSASFRFARIDKSAEPIFRQPFEFLGGCAKTVPPYTPLKILLNRSISRPLVRGEARYIIFARAILLSLVAIGVPAFAIYSIILTPLSAKVYTREIPIDWNGLWSMFWPDGNVTILLSRLDQKDIANLTAYKVQIRMTYEAEAPIVQCETNDMGFVECPFTWGNLMAWPMSAASISLQIPFDEFGVYITPLQGDLRDLPSKSRRLTGRETHAITLFPGSDLSGLLFWTRREVIDNKIVWGSSPRTTIFYPEITGLQNTGANVGSRVATLTLYLQNPDTMRLLEDTVDSTAITGIATVGGFWTFLNGAFAFFFGANVLYFMFGRRPLSALGVVHIFQRRHLVRQWYEDFPAIHTEGGLPSSESAGIVAFIRERLVDLDEDPRETEDPQPESDECFSQKTNAGTGSEEHG